MGVRWRPFRSRTRDPRPTRGPSCHREYGPCSVSGPARPPGTRRRPSPVRFRHDPPSPSRTPVHPGRDPVEAGVHPESRRRLVVHPGLIAEDLEGSWKTARLTGYPFRDLSVVGWVRTTSALDSFPGLYVSQCVVHRSRDGGSGRGEEPALGVWKRLGVYDGLWRRSRSGTPGLFDRTDPRVGRVSGVSGRWRGHGRSLRVSLPPDGTTPVASLVSRPRESVEGGVGDVPQGY